MKQLLTLIFFSITLLTCAQSGQIKGRVVDQESGEVLPFAKVSLEQNGVMKYAAHSDFDGKFLFQNVPPGEYILRIRFIGFDEIQERIIVKENETSTENFELDSDTSKLSICELILPHVNTNSRDREVGAPTE